MCAGERNGGRVKRGRGKSSKWKAAEIRGFVFPERFAGSTRRFPRVTGTNVLIGANERRNDITNNTYTQKENTYIRAARLPAEYNDGRATRSTRLTRFMYYGHTRSASMGHTDNSRCRRQREEDAKAQRVTGSCVPAVCVCISGSTGAEAVVVVVERFLCTARVSP